MAVNAALGGGSGVEALERLLKVDPPLYLSPSPELSVDARTASRYLFSSLLPYCPKPPVDALLADEGFDAEQIWSQIDLLSRPIISLIRREVKRLEREPPAGPAPEALHVDEAEVKNGRGEEEEILKVDGEDENEDGEEEEEEDGGGDGGERENGVEDRFLKIKELEEYLEHDEDREYGLQRKGGRAIGKEEKDKSDEDDDEEEEDDGDSEFEDLDRVGDEDAENARYEDFFGRKKEIGGKRNHLVKGKGGPDPSKKESSDEEMDNEGTLSTHEKELLKLRAKIEEMEEANLGPKMWTMQGEVTAAKRPKNSALEVDLDFEHNMRPPPVITEEVTASIEDLIKKRIVEERFDDVQRAPDLPSKQPKELKDLDETKSKKGLAEIYEEEYAQQTGLAPAPLSSSDEQKKEATILFKSLCLKLDALSHFHFAPKPVIEEMSVQANVPALAMEEIAPVAVSDASMLAPEEVFQGKGDIKEEAELTQAERKRRRASKKRKFKVEKSKREAKKARQNVSLSHANGNEGS
ncbi:hypothetical protein AXF42_Ash000111 [Apostasia shenzhenica]|uniref:Uncharacterized protein n=1 Tax=Apostasia shenzhenica TaxID=1088818 RepID=A0A2I0AFG6_9ASPA|nr:hypothetical protein AXF42_Ash000111 [Apostasia shenzhenica]